MIGDNYSPSVTKYSREILAILLRVDSELLGNISEIKVWKQSQKIDLWIEVYTDRDNFAMVIEDKAYSSTHNDQLNRYKDIFEAYYSEKSDAAFQRHYIVVVLGDKIPKKIIADCKQSGYIPFSFETIYSQLKERTTIELTKCDLFDEFWFGTWW